jgi:hypothetical protein
MWWLLGAACSNGSGPAPRPCTAAGFPVTLSVGQYVTIDPVPDSGCTVFPANGVLDAEYVIVSQLATGEPGKTSSFRLRGDTIRPAALAVLPGASLSPDALSPAEQFHAFLRHGDEERWRGVALKRGGPATLPPLQPPAGAPPVYGEARTFRVCSKLNCSTFATVTATARAVKNKVAIFVDDAAPAGGLDSLSLDALGVTFDTRLYPTDTAAFGRESDIDNNSVVLVLMTPVVNKLVTAAECTKSGFVAGFFYGLDLEPTLQNSNSAELFYALVPDPSGTLSCSHSVTEVQRIVPITFIHEFQHMISYNQHVLVGGGSGEMLWLNEGFSHYAEELGGRSYGTGTPEFSRFTIGDLYDAYQYLDSTDKHFLEPTAGIGSLAERGAAWLFVRYVVDRYSGGTTATQWNALTRQLLQTTNTGAQNIAAVTGQPFETVVSRWALANWVSDLPGFVAPAALKYDSWGFRSTYASLHVQDSTNFRKAFPLTPTQSSGRATDISGTLRAGSGVYHSALQSPGEAGFTLHFTTSTGGLIAPALVPRLSVIRIK